VRRGATEQLRSISGNALSYELAEVPAQVAHQVELLGLESLHLLVRKLDGFGSVAIDHLVAIRDTPPTLDLTCERTVMMMLWYNAFTCLR
jgi:hypothetical protein